MPHIARLRWLPIWAVLAAAIPLTSGFAQSRSGGSQAYLRIANLLPVLTPKVDLYRGGERYLLGMKAGFFQSYLPVPDGGSNRFTVKQGDAVLDSFSIPQRPGNQFYTLIIYQEPGKGATVLLKDDALEKPKSESADQPPEPPKPRLRVFAGGYDFPIKVVAKGVGEWVANNSALLVDQPIEGTPPEIIQVVFVDKYDQIITLNFPTDYKAAESYTAFISQRGIKRPRIQTYADNTLPTEDPLAAAEIAAASPSPTPTPAPVP